MKATIWHNPGCGTSRNMLALLQARGDVELEVVEYLKHPPSRGKLAQLYLRRRHRPARRAAPARHRRRGARADHGQRRRGARRDGRRAEPDRTPAGRDRQGRAPVPPGRKGRRNPLTHRGTAINARACIARAYLPVGPLVESAAEALARNKGRVPTHEWQRAGRGTPQRETDAARVAGARSCGGVLPGIPRAPAHGRLDHPVVEIDDRQDARAGRMGRMQAVRRIRSRRRHFLPPGARPAAARRRADRDRHQPALSSTI